MAERLVPDPDAGSDFDGPPDGRLRFLQLAALHENMAEATMHRRCGRVEGYGPPGGHHAAHLDTLLDQVAAWSTALAPLRTASPAPAV